MEILGLVGLVAGGPTFIGTMIGYYFISPVTSVLFLSLAAGAIVYIIGELFHVNRRPGLRLSAGWGLFIGFLLAFLTDMVLVFAGA